MGNVCKIPLNEDKDLFASQNFQSDSPREKIKIKELEQIKTEIMELQLFERKKIAEQKYNEYIKSRTKNKDQNDFIKEYIELIRLILLDETNKDIVILYLNFLKDNEISIRNNNLMPFKEEIKKYKFLFTIDEMNTIEKGVKKESEKANFISFLDKLSKVNNKNKVKIIYKEIENESKLIKYFNYPIEFSNQELFYYKLYVLLIMSFKKIKDNNSISNDVKNKYILDRSNVAKLVLREKILENENIINNEDKMNILILLILYDVLDKKGESVNFNRLLQTEKAKYEDIKNYINKNNLGIITMENQNKTELVILENRFKENWIIKIEIDKVCKNNLNKKNLDYTKNKGVFNTLDSLLKDNNIRPYIDRIKQFLIHIVNSNVYNEAIQILFPKNNKYLLGTNLKDIEECINKRFKFYPYQDLGDSGLTDKFSCFTYIPILIFDLAYINQTFFFTLIISAIIENSIHEINHLNQDILYFKGNDITLFFIPKRKNLKGEDGGANLEEILFGERIKNLRMLECFYILNEDNYNQSLKDFKKNFENLYNDKIAFSVKMKFLKNNKINEINEINKNNKINKINEINKNNKINENNKNNKSYKINKIFKEFFDDIEDYEEKDFTLIELYGINTKKSETDFLEAEIKIPREHCKVGF